MSINNNNNDTSSTKYVVSGQWKHSNEPSLMRFPSPRVGVEETDLQQTNSLRNY